MSEPVRLQLLGWWDLRIGGRSVALGRREQRLLALLALTGRHPRLELATTLWPDSSEERAMSSLRAAVWHTRHGAEGVLDASGPTLALADGVAVDVHELTALAARAEGSPEAADTAVLMPALHARELLPGWYDDWVLYEREHLEHLRFRALEAMARSRLRSGDPEEAALAAQTALQIEPLHEGANLLLVRARIAADDIVEAVRHFHAYRRRLAQELGILPSGQLVDLVRPFLVARQPDRTPVAHASRR
jgi:DNA-binding SARP family transcriptional activator